MTDLAAAHRARRRLEPAHKRALARVEDPDRQTIADYVHALVIEVVIARRELATLDAIRALTVNIHSEGNQS